MVLILEQIARMMFVINSPRFGQMGGLLPLVQMFTAAAHSLLSARYNRLERARLALIGELYYK